MAAGFAIQMPAAPQGTLTTDNWRLESCTLLAYARIARPPHASDGILELPITQAESLKPTANALDKMSRSNGPHSMIRPVRLAGRSTLGATQVRRYIAASILTKTVIVTVDQACHGTWWSCLNVCCNE